MKKLVLLAALLISTNCFSNELHNFEQIKAAVLTGQTIHIVVDFSKCSSSHKALAESVSIGVFTPNAMQVINDHIVTSLTHFTLDNPSFPGKAIYEFVKYTITDNKINLTSQALDAINYMPLSNKFSFTCAIDESVKIYA